MILKFFKSPTCGPCKMFTPQIKSAIAETNVTEEDYDVSTETGLADIIYMGTSCSSCPTN